MNNFKRILAAAMALTLILLASCSKTEDGAATTAENTETAETKAQVTDNTVKETEPETEIITDKDGNTKPSENAKPAQTKAEVKTTAKPAATEAELISIPDISFILSLRFPPPSDPNSTYPNEEFRQTIHFPIHRIRKSSHWRT